MSDPAFTVLLVYSTNHALRGEHLLKRADIACKLIPVPRHLASDCGGCIRVAREDRERACTLLESNGLEIEGVHDL